MGLSEMGASAQLAEEMTPEGYWNPAPTTAPVINLFDKAQRMTMPRGMLPDAVEDGMPLLIKACSRLRLTYEIKLAQYMASQAGTCLWLDVIAHCRFSDGLNAYIREHSIKVTRSDT